MTEVASMASLLGNPVTQSTIQPQSNTNTDSTIRPLTQEELEEAKPEFNPETMQLLDNDGNDMTHDPSQQEINLSEILGYDGPLINPSSLTHDQLESINYNLVNNDDIHHVLHVMSKLLTSHPESMIIRPATRIEVMLVEPKFQTLLKKSDKVPCPCIMLVGKVLLVAIPPPGVAGDTSKWKAEMPSYKDWLRQVSNKTNKSKKPKQCKLCNVGIRMDNIPYCCAFHKQMFLKRDELMHEVAQEQQREREHAAEVKAHTEKKAKEAMEKATGDKVTLTAE